MEKKIEALRKEVEDKQKELASTIEAQERSILEAAIKKALSESRSTPGFFKSLGERGLDEHLAKKYQSPHTRLLAAARPFHW